MLKAILDTLDGLPEAQQGLYKLENGKYVLDAEIEEHPKVHGLKNALTNVREEHRLAKEALAPYKGVDLTKYKQMEEHERQIAEGKLIAEGKVEELVALRTSALKEALTAEIEKWKTEAGTTRSQLDTLVIDNAVHTAAAKHGVKKTAMDDVMLRARAVFRTHEGKAVAFQGENPMYGKDGTSFLGIDEWMQNLPAIAGHLFEDSKGSGAPGGGAPKGVPGPGTVARGDQDGFLKNIEKIAAGQVKVVG